MSADIDPQPAYTRELSAWLERPEVRITRALRVGEWATREDLFGALDLRHDERARYQLKLERLIQDGLVRQRAEKGGVRYLLVRALKPPAPPAPDTDDEVTHEVLLDAPGIDGAVRQVGPVKEFFWRGQWRLW